MTFQNPPQLMCNFLMPCKQRLDRNKHENSPVRVKELYQSHSLISHILLFAELQLNTN